MTLNASDRCDMVDEYAHANQFSPRASLLWRATDSTTPHVGYSRYFKPPPIELVTPGSVALFDHTTAANATGKADLVSGCCDRGAWSLYANTAYSRALGKDIDSAQFDFSPADLAYISNLWIHLDYDQRWRGSGAAVSRSGRGQRPAPERRRSERRGHSPLRHRHSRHCRQSDGPGPRARSGIDWTSSTCWTALTKSATAPASASVRHGSVCTGRSSPASASASARPNSGPLFSFPPHRYIACMNDATQSDATLGEAGPLAILIAPQAILRQKTRLVRPEDIATLRPLLGRMFSAMYHAPGIGLAAPQVGLGLRFAIIDLMADEVRAPIILINPEITHASDTLVSREEGCLSLPNQYADVIRPRSVRVRYQDLGGSRHDLDADGLLATCLQHEIDHLDGVLFVDHLSALKRNMLMRKLAKEQKIKAAG